MRRRRTLNVAVAVATALLLVACGSTSRPARQATSTGGPTTTTTVDEATPISSARPGGGAATGAGATSVDVRGGASGAPSGGTPPAPAAAVRGVTGSVIRVGVVTVEPGSAGALAAAGFRNIDPGDTTAYWRALIADQNKRGGLFGRRLELVLHTMSITTSDISGELQEACTVFTQDRPVYVAFSDIIFDDAFATCMSRARVPLFYSYGAVDEKTLIGLDSIVLSGGLTLDRVAKNIADGLQASGFFSSKPRIGLVRVDAARYAAAERDVLKPALAKHGLSITATVAVSPVNEGDYGRLSSQLAAAVLRFRSENVTHVLFLATNATEPLLFMSSASSQGYRPRYGLTSIQAPSVLESSAPRDQIEGVTGVGWMPLADVSDARDPGASAAQKRCDAVMKSANVEISGRTARLLSHVACDPFWLFASTATKLARPPAAAGLISAIEARGTSYASVLTFESRFAVRHRDGATSYRAFRWDAGCECLGYSSGRRPLS